MELQKPVSQSKLLLCPFCPDGKAKEVVYGSVWGRVVIECQDCGAEIGEPFDHPTQIQEKLKIVTEKWNRRHYPPEVEKAVERMKPKKPDNSGKYKRTCFCGKTVYIGVNKFCSDCGQALDWSE